MPKAIVLMTALVPTIGHAALIRFAETVSGGNPRVIVSARSFEPVTIQDRVGAIQKAFPQAKVFAHLDDNAPQNPDPSLEWDTAFWDYWKNIVNSFFTVEEDDIVVASEPYCIPLAKALNCQFMPFDLNRTLVPVKGTEVRKDMTSNWEAILPEFRAKIKKTVTIFGAESCGKTTMTKYLSNYYGAPYIEEWARPYLELVGPEITMDKMKEISKGQFALQVTAKQDVSSIVTFQDTDLFSTVGYYRICNKQSPRIVEQMASMMKSDLYIVMNDLIPFEPDILRYGDNKRESETQFWIDILNEFGCDYYVIKQTDLACQTAEARSVIDDLVDKTIGPIEEFIRD